ncbi:adhesion G protein-coupled receptor E3-like [Dromiciops gliroides]|uniref:adhesion G protein-coupled receptor E3-like n=1 Tax=Dromiciops gliroides TaxID=33562 RepID=UPI001CC735D1|nr:adhesion G protein-coupled receptor E3-like [Dromiciops gliroides]
MPTLTRGLFLGLCILVLLETAAAQTPKDPPCRRRCPQHAICINGTHCTCKNGFASSTGKKYFSDPLEICDDINECVPPTDVSCGQNADCVNTEGSYHCTCISGYALPSGEKIFPNATMNNCQDVDECQLNSSLCAPNGVCKNELQNYTCICKPGFAKSSKNQLEDCIDKDECQDKLLYVNECVPPSTISCGQNAACVNTYGDYHCTCIPGYKLPSGEKTFPNATMNDCQDISFPTSPLNPGGSNKLENLSYHLESFTATHAFWTAKNKRAIATKVTNLLQDLEQAAWEDAIRSPDGKIQMVQNKSVLAIETHVISNCSQENGTIKLEAQNNSMKIFCMDIIHSDTQGLSAVAFLSYSYLGAIINASFFEERHGKESYGIYLNSQVVSTAIGPQQSESSSLSVILEFQHMQKKREEEMSLCVYWEAQLEEGGVWSTKGCNLIKSNEMHTSCNCTHMSTFAVLMAPIPQEEDCVLTVITYVGLSLSLLCLFLAALTFLLCRTIQNTSTSLHLQLSLCLFLANLIFLTGIKHSKNQVLCSIIAGLLHYFYLASFTWMLLEGLHLFLTARNLMVVNYSRVSQSLKKVMYPLGYGIPAGIVAISAASRAGLYGTSSHCWLKPDKGFLWAFLGPVCTIFCVNFTFILLALWILHSKLSSLNSEVSTIQDTRLLTFKALAQLCILGCTWCLGILQIGSAAQIMAYLFTIINSLQGVFIFLVYCLFNYQVREQYKRWFMTIRQKKSDSESLMLSSKVVSGSSQTHSENQEESIKYENFPVAMGRIAIEPQDYLQPGLRKKGHEEE